MSISLKNVFHYTLWSSIYSLILNLLWLIVLPLNHLGTPIEKYLTPASLLNSDVYSFILIALLFSSLLNVLLAMPFSVTGSKHNKIFIFSITLWTQIYWIGLELIKKPSYFADTLLEISIFKQILGLMISIGPLGYSLLLLIYLYLILKISSFKSQHILIAIFVIYLPWLQIKTRDVELPPKSQILIFSDSLRETHWNKAQMPLLYDLAKKSTSLHEAKVLPVSSRTTTAMTTFFTGLLPKDHHTNTMFSMTDTHLKKISWIDKLPPDYCTIVVADASGDFFSRHNYGFDFVIAPKNSWQTQINSTLIKGSPFILAWMASYQRSRYSPQIILDALEASLLYTDPNTLFAKASDEIATKCRLKSVFAVLFSGSTHMPYFQSWPFYRNIYQHINPQFYFFYWLKQYDNRKQTTHTLYNNAVLAFDEAASKFIKKTSSLSPSTSFVITSDHAEYLYDDDDLAGHGDAIRQLDGLISPLIILGPLANVFQSQTNDSTLLSNKWYAQYVLKIAPSEKYNYTETELWLTNTYRPKESIHYPVAEELLTIDKENDYLIIKSEWENIVEIAKHRTWIWDKSRLDMIPEKSRINFFLNSKRISEDKIPADLSDEIKHYKTNYLKYNPHLKN